MLEREVEAALSFPQATRKIRRSELCCCHRICVMQGHKHCNRLPQIHPTPPEILIGILRCDGVLSTALWLVAPSGNKRGTRSLAWLRKSYTCMKVYTPTCLGLSQACAVVKAQEAPGLWRH